MEHLNRRIDIDTCREHHEAIRTLLEAFPTNPPLDGEATERLLKRLVTLLSVHLKLEDDYLYPALERSAHRTVRETAVRYRTEMGGLRGQFTAFAGTWASADEISARPSEFLSAWSAVRAALEVRMAKEDHGLYAIAQEDLSREETA
ncbi:MAG: hemerythrin domain-containing protein [Vulcanimicrobiaceae bacterium]